MPTYDIEGVGKFTSDSELSEAELGQLIEQHSAHSAAGGIGKLRRREGEGQIAALAPRSEQPQFIGNQPDSSLENTQWMDRPDRAQALKEESQRVKERLSQIAGTAAGFAVPPFRAVEAAPLLLRAAASLGTGATGGATQMAAEEATKQILGASEPSVSKLATETGKGLVGGALLSGAGSALMAGGERAYGAAKEFLAPGVDRAKRVLTTLWPSVRKPLRESQEMAAEARAAIKRQTDIDVPIGVSEAVGHPETARRLATSGKEGSEFGVDEQDAVKRTVAMAAAELRGSDPSPQELGNRAISLLEDEIGKISAPAKAAVQATANELHPRIKTALQEVQNDAQALIPGTVATPTATGNATRNIVESALQEVGNRRKEAYRIAEELAPPDLVEVQVNGYKGMADKIGFQTPHTAPTSVNQSGNVVTGLIPKESRQAVNASEQAGNTWTLSQALRTRSEIGRGLRNPDMFPGFGVGDLKGLYRELTGDIENALSKGNPGLVKPGAKQAWKNAWEITKEESDRFNFPYIANVVDEFGKEGGRGGASIAADFTSADAPTKIAVLEAAVGQKNIAALDKIVGEHLFNQVGNAARNPRTGEISVDDILTGIKKLAPEVQARYFKNASAITKLANREAALAGLTKATKGEALDAVKGLSITDPALLAEALGPTASSEVTKKLQLALSESAKEAALYKGTVLGRLKAGNADGIADSVRENPTKFVRSIVDGTFSPKEASTAINVLKSHDPEVFKNLQFHFVDHLLTKFQNESVGIQTSKIASELMGGTHASIRSEIAEMAETVLGTDKLNTLRRMIGAFAELDRQGNILTPASPMADVAARAVGGAVGASGAVTGMGTAGAAYQANWLSRNAQSIRHWMGSYLLTTPELRKLALTPIDRIPPETANAMMRGFSAFVLSQVPDGSEEAHQARQLGKQFSR